MICKFSLRFARLGVFLGMAACSQTDEPAPAPTPTGPETQKDIAAVDNAINSFMTTYNITGASLAVTKNGKLVYIKGYGLADRSTNEAVTPAHRFRLASLSKTYTGVAILKLVQEGKLSLDTKVFGAGGVLGNDYGTAPYNANVSAITVRHLLHHSSGSWGAASGGDVIDANPSFTYKQLFDWVLTTRPNPNVPGTTFDYTNVGYSLLGRIVEKVSGKSYINFVREDLLRGVGATQTELAGQTEAERKAPEVKYYGQGNDERFTYNIAFPRRDADGGLIATAADVLRLVTAVDGFATRPDLLNPVTLTQFTTPTVSENYACGIGIWQAERVWYNYGSLPGTRTGFMRHDNGMCVALLCNSRVDPRAGENPFVFAMQDLLLGLTKNTTHPWLNIDQF
ncbi:MAG: beta-lactamase family protein [Bernardetiaceae bacterium]|jgi:CubicO group peptidase (beta-lactamase class C family)|nr:beta-lactamase family protein [Bernardetiaceae bacterium]